MGYAKMQKIDEIYSSNRGGKAGHEEVSQHQKILFRHVNQGNKKG
jgi:hypothetical protein